jgi:hypothetical protein
MMARSRIEGNDGSLGPASREAMPEPSRDQSAALPPAETADRSDAARQQLEFDVQMAEARSIMKRRRKVLRGLAL